MNLKKRYLISLLGFAVALLIPMSTALFMLSEQTTDRILTSSINQSRTALSEQIRRHAESTINLVGNALVNPLYRFDMDSIEIIVRAGRSQDGVTDLLVADQKLRIIHDGTQPIHRYGMPLPGPVDRSTLGSGQNQFDWSDDFLVVTARISIGSRELGFLQGTFSLDTLKTDITRADQALTTISVEARRYYIIVAAAMAVLILVLAIVASMILASNLSSPIRFLLAATRRVSEGDFRPMLFPSRRDEIGQLALAFDEMSRNLSLTTVSKNHMDRILDGLPDSLLVYGDHDQILFSNRAARLLAGASCLPETAEDPFLGEPKRGEPGTIGADKSPTQQSNGAVLAIEINRHIAPLIEMHEPARVEIQLNVAQRERWFEAHASPLGPEGTVVVLREITERKHLEEQLRESQKMKAVGQLAGGIAHEFNNMLQVIINSAHFARSSIHEPEFVDEFLGNILKAAKRSATLTKQLLAYSRKSAMVPTTLDLNEMTSGLMKMVRPVIGEGVELEFREGDDLSLVKADRSLLEQAIINLCVNARDAMPEGGRLMLRTKNHHADQKFCDLHGLKQPGDYVMISVTDNGVGVSSKIREHIFEPFFTTKEAGQGTGLGLAMVHGVVQQHDGVIEALSEPGVGSTFNIYLPRTDSQEAKKEVSVVGESPGGSETILVAEDEEDVLNMLSKALESKGYRVLAAKDGEEAMSVFKANTDRIDLVILDMVMPKLRGRAVYEKIRESESDVRVLFSTGYTLDSSDAEFAAEKGLHTIQKPYAPDVLLTTVREVLDERQTVSSLAAPAD